MSGWLKHREEAGTVIITAGGDWDVRQAVDLDAVIQKLPTIRSQQVTIDLDAITRMDTAGAWLLHRTIKNFRQSDVVVDLAQAKDEYRAMLEKVAENDLAVDVRLPHEFALYRIISGLGSRVVQMSHEAHAMLAFLGQTISSIIISMLRPWRIRWTPLFHHMEKVGLNAVPIVALISFLIGIVLAYQGATQLQKFGAEIFVVDLIAISVLREIGILLTAIVLAGRSGSAFTAEIGSMVVNEEVDAMRSLGLDPMEVLVLPRILALVIMLPILAFIADMMGLAGGFIMAWTALGISPNLFLEQLNNASNFWTFGVGILKSPFFAFIIAFVGCYEGLRVDRNAASVGTRTTRSVVTSIFLIIVADAAFSIMFALIGI
jgi:phospholipid/cholesterol/gamma-HCH transport system permease protein